MQRLKTRPQFQAALKGDTVARTAHFALHRVALPMPASDHPAAVAAHSSDTPGAPVGMAAAVHFGGAAAVASAAAPVLLFPVADAWLGAMVPKRWARRAVTRNAIKRQIYAVAAALDAPLPQAAHVVRLRAAFDRKQFVSATSDALQQAARAELVQLFARAAGSASVAAAAARGAAA